MAEQPAAKQRYDQQCFRAVTGNLRSSLAFIPAATTSSKRSQVGTPAKQTTASSSPAGRQQIGGGRKGKIRQIPCISNTERRLSA